MAEGEPKGGDADHPEPMTYEEAQTKGLTDKQFQVGLLRGWILPAGPDADLGAP